MAYLCCGSTCASLGLQNLFGTGLFPLCITCGALGFLRWWRIEDRSCKDIVYLHCASTCAALDFLRWWRIGDRSCKDKVYLNIKFIIFHWESIWNYCIALAQSPQGYSGSSECIFQKKICTLCEIEDVDVANDDNSVAVHDKNMKFTDRKLKKENKKFDKELVARIAPDWVFEDLEEVFQTFLPKRSDFRPVFANSDPVSITEDFIIWICGIPVIHLMKWWISIIYMMELHHN